MISLIPTSRGQLAKAAGLAVVVPSRKGINHRWETIRDQMATQVRITTAMTTEKGE
jgi:hypothetical protein